jgi:uncharacterized MAPEG superfamily protein
LNGRAERVHLAMNNNRGDYPVINGLALIKEMLLEDWRPPDRGALIDEFEERRANRKTKRPAEAGPRDGHEATQRETARRSENTSQQDPRCAFTSRRHAACDNHGH